MIVTVTRINIKRGLEGRTLRRRVFGENSVSVHYAVNSSRFIDGSSLGGIRFIEDFTKQFAPLTKATKTLYGRV